MFALVQQNVNNTKQNLTGYSTKRETTGIETKLNLDKLDLISDSENDFEEDDLSELPTMLVFHYDYTHTVPYVEKSVKPYWARAFIEAEQAPIYILYCQLKTDC